VNIERFKRRVVILRGAKRGEQPDVPASASHKRDHRQQGHREAQVLLYVQDFQAAEGFPLLYL
jgi:hypothetical protein